MEKTIYALGFFDGVHLGHQALLGQCRELARHHGAKPGAVTFDTHPELLLLGQAPGLINTQADKTKLLMQYYMETVITLPFDRAMMDMPWQAFLDMLVRRYGAAGLVCGEDFSFGCRGQGTAELLADYCKQRNMPCAVVPQQKLEGVTVSSTHIRRLLEAGALEEANRFLGHPHILSGTVVPGRQLGRTIGIPTANIPLPPGAVRLPKGVYACRAGEHLAVTNIGSRPTVGGHEVRAESWLLDFEGDLYGQELTLEFHKFLRPERKFDSLEALQTEIQRNAAETRKIFEKS